MAKRSRELVKSPAGRSRASQPLTSRGAASQLAASQPATVRLPAWELISDLLHKKFAAEWGNAKRVQVLHPEFNSSLVELRTDEREIQITQSFKPDFDDFAKAGFEMETGLQIKMQTAAQTEIPTAAKTQLPSNLQPDPSPSLDPSPSFDLALIVPTRQRQETLAMFAQAILSLSHSDSWLLMACENSQGAAGYLTKLQELAPNLESDGARKCKWARLRKAEIKNPVLLQEWLQGALPQKISGTEFIGQPGIYGWNKVDEGSQLLRDALEREVPDGLAGRGADLGAGYGFLSHGVLAQSSAVTELHLIEAESRALACAKLNLKDFGNRCQFHWLDVNDTNLNAQSLGGALDFVIMNPPFHEGAQSDLSLGQSFIRKASQLLRPGGVLFMVANVFLAYEKTLEQHFKRVTRLNKESSRAYKMFRAHK